MLATNRSACFLNRQDSQDFSAVPKDFGVLEGWNFVMAKEVARKSEDAHLGVDAE